MAPPPPPPERGEALGLSSGPRWRDRASAEADSRPVGVGAKIEREAGSLTPDPMGLAGGVNLYAYAGSNPVAFLDAFGLKGCTWQVAGNGGPTNRARLR